MEFASSSTASSGLLDQVRQNEPLAWKRLSRLYAPLVYRWCRRSGLQSADIADIAQNVFLAVHRTIGDFRRDTAADTFRGWLWTISRNEVRQHLRRAGQQPLATGGTDAQQVLQQVPALFESDSLPPELSGRSQVAKHALQMIRDEFEATTWQAFWRTTIDEQTGPAVAEELGITPQAVRQAKYRVLKRLRAFLAED